MKVRFRKLQVTRHCEAQSHGTCGGWVHPRWRFSHPCDCVCHVIWRAGHALARQKVH